MDTRLTVLISGFIIVLFSEFVLWRLFRRRVNGFLFSREIDISHFRFFTLLRLRLCAVLHAVLLLVILLCSLWFVW